ncbi:MAG: hypothetical protein ACREJ4_09245, partial [Candidatus Methylomirabilaceae bacterium]
MEVGLTAPILFAAPVVVAETPACGCQRKDTGSVTMAASPHATRTFQTRRDLMGHDVAPVHHP